MKSLSNRNRHLILFGILCTFIILAGLSLPRQVGALQTTPDPTPTITPVYPPGEEPLKSGETGGLMLGAAAILLIIVSGVSIQRVIQKRNPQTP